MLPKLLQLNEYCELVHTILFTYVFLPSIYCSREVYSHTALPNSMHGGISGEGLRMLDNFRRS